jgi:predicted MFS family arabinose efflux permease
VPRLTLVLFAGALTDRYDRVRIMVLIHLLSALPVFVMVILYYSGLLAVWHIIVLEVIVSIVKSASPSATQSLIRELVPESQIMNAVALSSAAFNGARVLGPSLGGLLILWIGVGGCFFFDGIALVVAGLQMLLIRRRGQRLDVGKQNLLDEIRAGVRYIGNTPTIIALLGVAYTMSVCVGTYQRFLPIFAKDILQVGPEGLGLMISAPGAGAMVAVLILAGRGDRWDAKNLLWLTAILSPLFLVFFCFAPDLPSALFFLALVGAGQIAFRTLGRVLIQYEVPVELLGRVTSVFVIERGLNSVGAVILGGLTTAFGAALGLAFAAAISLAATLVFSYRFLRPRHVPRAKPRIDVSDEAE